MKLKSILINGMFGQYDSQLDLSKGGLTFIHSPNGTGKSAFLRIVSLAFSGDEEGLADMNFQRMVATFEDGFVLFLEKESDGGFTAAMRKNEISEEIPLDELPGVLGVLHMPPDRNIITMSDGHMAPAVEVYTMEFADRFASWEGAGDIHAAPMETDMTDGELIELCKDLKARVDFIRGAGMEVNLPSDLKFPPNRFDVSKNRLEYAGLAHAVGKFTDGAYGFAESVSTYLDIVNGLFVGKRLTVGDGRVRVITDDGEVLKLSKLSSGEKQVIVVFYRLLFHTKPGDLVIIDEPEISLHIVWQHRVSDLLVEIGKLKDLQIIAATHSPQMIHDKWDLAKEMRMERVQVR
ncbi:MAG: AAA family ATPase [Thermoplasmatales archaeon]|nr:AAA family ATPase [Thermoplasmatales archaeon]